MSEEQAGQRSLRGRLRWILRVRDRVRATPGGRHVYRVVVAVVGLTVTLGGLALVPLPGPGWLVVFVGLAILASEFVWAQRLLDLGRVTVRAWTHWLLARSVLVRFAVSLVTAGFVAGVLYLLIRWRGVPGWLLEVVPLASAAG